MTNAPKPEQPIIIAPTFQAAQRTWNQILVDTSLRARIFLHARDARGWNLHGVDIVFVGWPFDKTVAHDLQVSLLVGLAVCLETEHAELRALIREALSVKADV